MTTTTNGTAPAPKRTKAASPVATDASVRSIYRTSIKIGDDFHTLEGEITVPVGASDDLIREAQATADRVGVVQREATQAAIADLREDAAAVPQVRNARYTPKDPDAPATDKQRTAIDRIAERKGWSLDVLVTFCETIGYPVLTLTKAQASWLIDMLDSAPVQPPPPTEPAPESAAAEALPFVPDAAERGAAAAAERAEAEADIPF